MPSTSTSILDGLSTSVAFKAPCVVAFATNNALSGLQGYSEGDRALCFGQTNPVDNGIYSIASGQWQRTLDADGNRDFVQGTRVVVSSDTFDGIEYELVTENPIVVGTSSLSFVQRYGANAVYDQTAAEASAGVTPTNTGGYPAYKSPPRYGSFGDATTDDSGAIQRQYDSAAEAGSELDLWGTTSTGYRINTAIDIHSPIKFKGGGYAKCGLITHGNNAFNIAAGVTQCEFSGFRVNSATRYSDSANTLKAFNIQGTNGSPCYYHKYRDLFIDGFETPIQAAGVYESVFDGIITVFGKNGIIADKSTVNNWVTNCHLSGSGIAGSTGIQVGDGTNATEGWTIANSLIYSFGRGVWGYGASNSKVVNCFIDFFTEYGVFLLNGAATAATNWDILSNYIAAIGTASSSGIRCLNSYATAAPTVNLRGNRIAFNDILVYNFGGATLAYGILIDGTQEINNSIMGNHVACSGGGGFDLKIDTGASSRVLGNQWRTTGASIASGVNPVYENNTGTVSGLTPTVASAAALTLPPGAKDYLISGTTNITSIVATGHAGDKVTLIFQGALTFTDGSNLKLAGNYVTTADDTISLYCDGTSWIERSRSTN